MASLYLIFLLIFVTSAASNNEGEEEDMYRDINQNEFIEKQETCSRYFRSSIRKLIMLLTGAYADDGQQASQTKCWVTCLLKTLGMITDQGNLQPDAIYERIAQENQSKMNASVAICVSKSSKSASHCDRGYNFVNCMYTNMKKVGKGVPDEDSVEEP